MALFIDSAVIQEIEQALALGWVSGVTTNPLLLSRVDADPETTLKSIRKQTSGPVFYQLQSQELSTALKEIDRAERLLENQLVLKLPPTELGFKLCSQLAVRMQCCPTAIYSPAQALVARAAQARFIAVYVNRATRLMGDGIALLRGIAEILSDSQTEILAASIKTPDEAVAATLAGAQHLTLPYETLIQLPTQTFSDAAVEEFRQNGVGLRP